jgi:hypothetical protein
MFFVLNLHKQMLKCSRAPLAKCSREILTYAWSYVQFVFDPPVGLWLTIQEPVFSVSNTVLKAVTMGMAMARELFGSNKPNPAIRPAHNKSTSVYVCWALVAEEPHVPMRKP